MGFISNKVGTKAGGGFISRKIQSVQPKTDLLHKASNIVGSIFPGKQLGTAIGNSIDAFRGLAGGDMQRFQAGANSNNNMIGKVIGDVAQSVALPASLGIAAPASVLGAVGQYGGLSAIQGAGSRLASGGNVQQATKDAAISGAIGGVVGGVFNLLGKGISKFAEKTAPSALSFTSGVPKSAIERTMSNPVGTKEGLKMSVPEIRTKAIGSLNSLYKDLGDEFSVGLETIKKTVPDITKSMGTEAPNAVPELKNRLINIGKNLAREYRVSFAKGGVDFSKSNIINPSEQKNVIDTISTLQSWKDFSPGGLQDLAERVGALRKFDSGATTKASAIVGQVYNNIAGEKGIISTLYPELKALRTNFAQNRHVLDEISNVLSADKGKPVNIQGAVSRLDGIFAQNKDAYINAIRQLGERSGVDYLSLLAGGEFQKILPDFVRGIGGGGALAVGSQVLNPWLVLLAPLFSPRAVGSIVRNAPSVGQTTSHVIRATSVQAIPKLQRE